MLIACLVLGCFFWESKSNALDNDTLYLLKGDRVKGEFKGYGEGEVLNKTNVLFNA